MTIMCALADHYIQVDKTPEGAYWLYGNDRGDDNPNINGVITWANALIAFQVRPYLTRSAVVAAEPGPRR